MVWEKKANTVGLKKLIWTWLYCTCRPGTKLWSPQVTEDGQTNPFKISLEAEKQVCACFHILYVVMWDMCLSLHNDVVWFVIVLPDRSTDQSERAIIVGRLPLWPQPTLTTHIRWWAQRTTPQFAFTLPAMSRTPYKDNSRASSTTNQRGDVQTPSDSPPKKKFLVNYCTALYSMDTYNVKYWCI